MFQMTRHLFYDEGESGLEFAADDHGETVYEPHGQCWLALREQRQGLDLIRLVR